MTINLNNLTYSAYLADAALHRLQQERLRNFWRNYEYRQRRFLDRGFTESQFNYIQANYRIVDHLPNTATGLSVTIFSKRGMFTRTEPLPSGAQSLAVHFIGAPECFTRPRS